MTVVVTTAVQCDGAGCGEIAEAWEGPSVDRPHARLLAGRAGWTIGSGRHGRDLCPTCTAKEAA